jgi:DNA ligase-1
MSKGGIPEVWYHVFDLWNRSDTPFSRRRYELYHLLLKNFHPSVIYLGQWRINSLEELRTAEQRALHEGYEGLIVRRMDAPYKFNRSTANEGYLLKIKRYCDAEAEIIAVNQKFHNANVAVTNELGLTSRSSSQENKVPLDQVGSFKVRDLKEGWEFEVHGFSHADASLWWERRDSLIGKVLTYRYLPKGMKDVPRHAVFKGFRDPDDIT